MNIILKLTKIRDKERPLKNTNYTIKELKKIGEEAKKSCNVSRKYVLVVAGEGVQSQVGAKEKKQYKFVMTN